MALTDLVDLELAVPAPEALAAFWERRGLRRTDATTLGTPARPSQLRLREGAYRHVSELRLACDDEADLPAIAERLARLGVEAVVGDGWLRTADPLGDHDVVVEVAAPAPPAAAAAAPANRPDRHDRVDRRAPACTGSAPPPRRLGHVVFGTPDVAASAAFYRDGLGFRTSDVVGGGIAHFLRCSPDHHNLLLSPAPIPVMNHYAFEVDDVDAIGLTGAAVLAEGGRSVAGVGRHVVGANLFWYLLDPAGGMFELFADMDRIVDDEAWEREQRRDDWDPFGVAAWVPGEPAPDFWMPVDLDELVAARAAVGR
ncbi:MAG: VOC family protein [Acidimicrobiales bacterium]